MTALVAFKTKLSFPMLSAPRGLMFDTTHTSTVCVVMSTKSENERNRKQ